MSSWLIGVIGVVYAIVAIDDILDYIAEEPDMLHEYSIRSDFVKALAMQEAMDKLGILYDA